MIESDATVEHIGGSPAPKQLYRDEEVLSAEGSSDTGLSFDPSLAFCGVPDTACRRTLVGAYTLRNIADLLATQGLSVKRARYRSQFRFGNSGTLVSEQIAILPARIGSRVICLKAAVLEGQGSVTPLLLSKELLRRLGAVLDMDSDTCYFRSLGETVNLHETSRGHYAIPMFNDVKGPLQHQGQPEELAEECLTVGVDTKDKKYDIDMLENTHQITSVAGFPQGEARNRPSSPNPPSTFHGEAPPSQVGPGVCGSAREVQQRDCRGHSGGCDNAGQASRLAGGRQ